MVALAALGAVLSQFSTMAADTISATSADIGKVIGANGNIYATVSAASSDGTTAYAMIAYVNAEDATGLAIAVQDIGNGYTWDAAMFAAASWAAAHPVEFGTWRLPTVDDFKYMFQGCNGPTYSSGTGSYGYGYFHIFVKDCGAHEIQQGRYWTGIETASSDAYQYNFYSARFDPLGKTSENWARCCLEFQIVSDTAGRTGDCRWRYCGDTKTLTIYGNGQMADYGSSDLPPWCTKYDGAITNVVVESGVTSIGHYAFFKCSQIKGLSLSDSIATIGTSAFYGCHELNDFAVPDNLSYIGPSAFRQCYALKTFTFPAELEFIDDCAFGDCSGITDVYCRPSGEKFTWWDASCDFKDDKSTRIHVRSDRLGAYLETYGDNVRGTFVGDMPYDSYAEWAGSYGFSRISSGIDVSADDLGGEIDLGGGVSGLLGLVDEQRGKGLALVVERTIWNVNVSEAVAQIAEINASNPDIVGTLRLPSVEDLKRCFTACGGSAYTDEIYDRMPYRAGSLDEKFVSNIWTSTECDEDNNWIYSYTEEGGIGWHFTKCNSASKGHAIAIAEFDLGRTDGWSRCDMGDGIANVFRYAFDKPGDFGGTPLLDIAFGLDGKAVVKTPKVVSTAGFSYSVVASDDVAGTKNVAEYPLSAEGETKMDEALSGARFFRLKAVPVPEAL